MAWLTGNSKMILDASFTVGNSYQKYPGLGRGGIMPTHCHMDESVVKVGNGTVAGRVMYTLISSAHLSELPEYMASLDIRMPRTSCGEGNRMPTKFLPL